MKALKIPIAQQFRKDRPLTSKRIFTEHTDINKATFEWSNKLNNNIQPMANRNSAFAKSPRHLYQEMFNEHSYPIMSQSPRLVSKDQPSSKRGQVAQSMIMSQQPSKGQDTPFDGRKSM